MSAMPLATAIPEYPGPSGCFQSTESEGTLPVTNPEGRADPSWWGPRHPGQLPLSRATSELLQLHNVVSHRRAKKINGRMAMDTDDSGAPSSWNPLSETGTKALAHSTQTLRNAMETLDTGGNPGQQVRRHLKKRP